MPEDMVPNHQIGSCDSTCRLASRSTQPARAYNADETYTPDDGESVIEARGSLYLSELKPITKGATEGRHRSRAPRTASEQQQTCTYIKVQVLAYGPQVQAPPNALSVT